MLARTRRLATLVILLLVLAPWVAQPARATLIGDFVDLSLDFDDPLHTDQALQDVEVVTPAAELQAGFTGPLRFVFGDVTVNVEDSEISITLFAGTEGPQFELPFLPALTFLAEDLQWVGEPDFILADVIPDPTNSPGFSVSFGPNEVQIEYDGLPPTNTQTLMAQGRFDLVHTLPEPNLAGVLFVAALALALCGLGRPAAPEGPRP